MLRQKWAARYANIRFAFMIVYILLLCFQRLIPYKLLVWDADSFLHMALPLAGLLLLAVDFFFKRNFLKIQFADILVLFFVAYLCSVFLNYKYEFVSNIKGFLWMIIQIFLLCGLDADLDDELHFKHFRILSNIFVLIFTAGAVWSLGQFIIDYAGYAQVIVNEKLSVLRVGFVDARLFGVFADPNYACVASLVSIGLAIFNLKIFSCPVPLQIYYYFSIVAHTLYAILSGSRTGWVAIIAVAFFVAGFLVAAVIKKKAFWLKSCAFITAGVLCALVSMGCYNLIKSGFGYVPGIYSSFTASVDSEQDIPSDSDFLSESDDIFSEQNQPHLGQTVDFERGDLVDNQDISNNRFSIWSDYLKLLKKSPVFGVSPRGGLEFAKDYFEDLYILQKQYSFHNGYLALFVSTGIIGGGLMLFWLIRVVIMVVSYLVRRWSTKDKFYWPIFICTAILLVEAISAFPLMALFFSNLATDVIFWIVLGYTLLMLRKSEPERYTKRSVVDRIFSRLFVSKRKQVENL